jgi:hypothetical protein
MYVTKPSTYVARETAKGNPLRSNIHTYIHAGQNIIPNYLCCLGTKKSINLSLPSLPQLHADPEPDARTGSSPTGQKTSICMHCSSGRGMYVGLAGAGLQDLCTMVVHCMVVSVIIICGRQVFLASGRTRASYLFTLSSFQPACCKPPW